MNIRQLYSRMFVLGTHWREFLDDASRAARETSVVLDAGSGQSPHRHLFRQCRRYVGIDIQCSLPAAGAPALDVQGDICSLPFADNVVDVILCTQVLEHTREPKRVLAEFYRVLKPGGQLFLSAPLMWPEHMQPMDYFRFTQFGMRDLFAAARFPTVELTSMGGLFSVCRLVWDELWNDRHLFRSRPVALITAPLRWMMRAIGHWIFGPVCYALDRFDIAREFTLGYFCVASKPPSASPRSSTAMTR
jgi:SAM-dependent methyltransferase